ncbi:MAG: saccharopine dehydrogenase C-terminal domain-containing protein [Gemmatimonadota bacterium]|jgi:saccharopine dehydrogenase-like NADP-dependent oxidoreductase
MNILLLGVGMQGRGALHDLARNDAVTSVVAADKDLPSLEAWVSARGYGDKVRCVSVDAEDAEALYGLMADGVDVVVDLLPVPLIATVAPAAVRAGVHLVNTSYASAELKALAPEAEARGVTLLPEMGMDPGIDLVLCGDAVRSLDEVTEVLAYGSGIPEPGADRNPLRYKVSWTFEGVLRAYHRPGTLVRDGTVVSVAADEQLLPEHVFTVEVEEVGPLECYPNGDVVGYLEILGLDPTRIRRAGRYSMRYPGHAAFWRPMVALGLLDDAPVLVDGRPVDRRGFLAAALEPRLQYAEGERDLAILRVEVAGVRDGRPVRVVHEVFDRKDLDTGLRAMSRLVGFTASIGALMVGQGVITRRGLLSPAVDVPCGSFVEALSARGVGVRSAEVPDAPAGPGPGYGGDGAPSRQADA